MPKTLWGHSSLSQGKDLIVVGGKYFSDTDYHYSDSIYKLTCTSGQFTWEELDMKLKTARQYFVADFIPNSPTPIATSTKTTTIITTITNAITTPTTTTTNIVCFGKEAFIGDGFCDDENNNEECNWDGGDCCGDNINTDYCSVCACLES